MNKLLLLLLPLVFTSCYRMPSDDDYCLIPATNNPTVTREKANTSLQPGGSY